MSTQNHTITSQASTTKFSVFIDPQLKQDAKAVLDVLGLTLSRSIAIYLHAIVREKHIPFSYSKKKAQTYQTPCSQRVYATVTINRTIRNEAVRFLQEDGVSLTSAINIYLHKIVDTQSLPFRIVQGNLKDEIS